MNDYVKLEDILDCVFDFFMTEEDDRKAFTIQVNETCKIIKVDDTKQ